MGYLKGKSTQMIYDRHPNLQNKWNKAFWARGYYIATIGNVTQKQSGAQATKVPYKKDTQDSTRWVIDEAAAKVVRRISRLCIAGKGPYDMVRILHDDKIERSSYYMGKRGLGTHCTVYDTENP